MHTVELLEQGLDLAERLGYSIRHEWLGGNGGGGCEVAGHKILFLDLADGPADQLDQVVDTLRGEPAVAGLPIPHQLREMLQLQKAA